MRPLLVARACLVASFALPIHTNAQVPSPEAHFGFRMGTDRRVASSDQMERYFELVAQASDRVELIDIGPTTEGHRTLGAIVSAPGNIRELAQIKVANRRLADPRTLSLDDARRLAAQH